MTTHNDPNINNPNSVQRRAASEGWSTMSMVLASLAALAVVVGIFFTMSGRNKTTATMDRPAVTTGSGPVTTPTTTPAQPRAVEAPAQSGPANTTGSGAVR